MHIVIAVLSLVLQQPEVPRPASLDDRLVVELVAAEPVLNTPTGMTVDARGRAWVIESNTHFPPKNYRGRPTDRILIFEDFAPDGHAQKVTTFAEGFRYAMGIGFGKTGDLYLATRWEVYRWHGRPDLEQRRDSLVKLDTKGNYPHNGLSGFAFDPEGNVYFGMGENLGAPYSLVGVDGTTIKDTEGGKIFRCKPDGTGLQQVATGFWNPFHQCFDAHGRLFIVDNDPDSRPPCRLVHVVQGGDYGFKFRNGRKGLHPFTAWNGELPGTLPMVCGTGEAPCALLEYQNDAFPADYRGTLLATSWGDHLIQRFALEPKGASFTAKPETIVQGGENFRPVGMAQAPDGSLFFSDWVDRSYELHGKGRLWRLRAKSPGTTPTASRAPKDSPELLRMNDVLATTSKERLAGLLPMLADPDPFLAGAAIDTLSRVGGPSFLLPQIAHPDPKIRLGVLLALRRTADKSAVGTFLEDADVAIRRAAIQWAGEDQLGDLAAAMEKTASRLPVTKEIFEAYLASTDLLAGRNPGQVDQVGSELLIARVFDDPAEPAVLRSLALRMLRPDHPSVAVPRLEKLIDSEPELRADAVRALMNRPDDAAQAILRRIADDRALVFDVVSGLAHSAASSEETRRILLAKLDGSASPEAIRSLSGAVDRPEVKEALDRKGGELVAILLGRPAGLPPSLDGWKHVAASKGDAAAGERLFYHPKGPQCFVCHRVNGRGGIVGPDLSTIGNVQNRDKLVESIVDPSREIAPMFVLWKIRTKKGNIYDGRILYEDPAPTGEIILIDAQGKQTKVKNQDIEDRQASKLSIMPEKLPERMTRQDFRDLIEFLSGLK
ncbi:MAG TPA: PVC-type heme-binding CxxCH protein [Planctomycetota bacterium]|nr:PVC-type heme-binding CxxCH protein [Planctomycetota bacterium]